MNKEIRKERKIRSYVLRQSGITKGQERAYNEFFPKYGLKVADGLLQKQQYINENPLILEIGFGMGSSLLEQAIKHNNYNYLGIEVHKPGVGSILASIAEKELTVSAPWKTDPLSI